jgi:hypothetical protein
MQTANGNACEPNCSGGDYLYFEMDLSYESECDGFNEMIWSVKEADPEYFSIDYRFEKPDCIR